MSCLIVGLLIVAMIVVTLVISFIGLFLDRDGIVFQNGEYYGNTTRKSK